MANKIKIAVIGASGYTGSDLIRLAVRHPNIEIVALTANTHAGKPMHEVFPHLANLGLPDLVKNDEVDWSGIDAVFCGLPHATSQDVIASLPDHIRVIDMSADFRLRDAQTYKQWYGVERTRHDLMQRAVYGLSEHYRDDIKDASLVACPGCYPTAVLTLLLPLVKYGLIDPDQLIIDAKSGVSGAGRGLKQNTLFSEAGEGMSAYAVAAHRHAPEIEQELSIAARHDVLVNFTPHLVPMARGEFITVHAKMKTGLNPIVCHNTLSTYYQSEPFIFMAPEGTLPATQYVRGSNKVMLGVYADRIPGRVILMAVLDNLVKGSAGQALQNFNLMFSLDETTGLEQAPMFP